ncbi:triose-phosphate isomerase [Candidatus Parcubacteria bacterium]|nr:MAG: triose-phosphate isomerase [Candidatus Parcubacteria bacterium]
MHSLLVIANWKMNPPTAKAARSLAAAVASALRGARGIELVIAPPFPYLDAVRRAAPRAKLAAQDAYPLASGPVTGAVSAAMLKDAAVRYTIVGHSERRRLFQESDGFINAKIRALLAAGITPVLAIGEQAQESQAVVPKAIATQLRAGLAGIAARDIARVVVAYEPVWAISTTPGAKPDTPDNATRRAIYIRKLLVQMIGRKRAEGVRIIYGGSVNAKNAATFIARDIRGMEGMLVGGASLKPDEFRVLVRSVAAIKRRV